jgi:hypothetical protein
MWFTLGSMELDVMLGLERGDDMSSYQNFIMDVYEIKFKRESKIESLPPLGVSVLHLLRTEE